MNILFIGSVLPAHYETKITAISNAGNRFQLNVIKNLKLLGCNIELYSFIGYPMEQYVDDSISGICDHEYYFVKQHGFLKEIQRFRKSVKKTLNSVDAILVYNNNYYSYGLQTYAARKKKQSVLLLADYNDMNTYSNVLMKLYSAVQLIDMRKYHKVIGLSCNTSRFLGRGQRFLMIEGGIDVSAWQDISLPRRENAQKIKFMYSGKLEHSPGADLAVNAFMNLKNENTELYITGNGSLKEWIQNMAAKDHRIHFLGRLEYENYINLYNEVNVLLNTRDMSLPENNNNFPSKMMEYLASGRVIVSTKFAGWNKFQDYVYFCENDINGISAVMEKVCNCYWQIYQTVYYNNCNFSKNFDWKEQIQKMIDFIDEKKN